MEVALWKEFQISKASRESSESSKLSDSTDSSESPKLSESTKSSESTKLSDSPKAAYGIFIYFLS